MIVSLYFVMLFLTPLVAGDNFLAALVVSGLCGALPPVDFLAVCFLREMLCCLFCMGSLGHDTLKYIFGERIHDAHGLYGDTSFGGGPALAPFAI